MRKSDISTVQIALASNGIGHLLGLTGLMFIVSTALPTTLQADINPVTGKMERGDVSAKTFDDYCEEALPPLRKSRALSELEAAESALDLGDIKAAEGAFSRARSAAYRGLDGSDISIKCLGEATAERWFDAQLELRRQQSAIEGRGSEQKMAALYVIAVEKETEAILDFVGHLEPRRFVASISTLEKIVVRIGNERKFGAFILSKEETLVESCREAVRELKLRAAKAHENALRAEERAYTRTISDDELDASHAVGSAMDVAETMTGVDLGSTTDPDAVVVDIRANESRGHLRAARVWNLETYPNRQSSPSSQRAKIRGDNMLSRAGNTRLSLALRDKLYEQARHYFNFGGFRKGAASATRGQKTIEPALEANRARQRKLLDEAGDELDARAKSIRRAVEDMTKSEEEQKSFEEEADAMEDELAF